MFGEVKNEIMILNEYGKIAEQRWLWLQFRYPYVVLHKYVIMPNHMHGILEIDSSLQKPGKKIKSLSELNGAYKTTTSKEIRIAGGVRFTWHRSFYDHIIRDERAFNNISNYIMNNPKNWKKDRFRKFSENK